MNKKNLFITILIIILLAASATFAYLWLQSSKKTAPAPNDQPATQLSDAQKFKKEYPTVSDSNKFVYKSVEQIIEQLESGTGVVYLGFPECPWCQEYVKYLDQIAVAKGLSEISYYNIKQIRSDNTAEYQEIVSLLQAHQLDLDSNGNPRIFVPELVFVKNGQILGRDNTTSLNSTEKDGTPAEWWTAERVAELKAKLEPLVDQIIDCGNVCNL